MSRANTLRAGVWIAVALVVEAVLLPQWIDMAWIPQISFLILLFAALKQGARAGAVLGLTLGIGQSLFSALPAEWVIGVYLTLGIAAGAAKNLIFLESPLAQWLAPIGFGLLVELAFFWMMPWDEDPLGAGEYFGMIKASNLPITWILSGFVYAWCDRRVFLKEKS